MKIFGKELGQGKFLISFFAIVYYQLFAYF